MSINLTALYSQQFATTLGLLLQQKQAKIRPTVMTGSHVGKQSSPLDQIGKIAMQQVTGRFSPIGRVDAAVDRRWVLPLDFDLNQLIDKKDDLRMIIDPKAKYLENAVAAANRKMDEIIVDALFGTAKTGETGSTSTTFPSGNQVAVNFDAAANTGLTVAKLREAKRLLMSYEVDFENDPLTAIITSKQHDNLLREVLVTSADFNGGEAVLKEGMITRFMGINLVQCERLGIDSNSYRRIPVYSKSALYLGIWNDVMTDIDVRKDLQSMPYQIYLQMTMGATRLEENKLIEIKCSEA
jgi:hypothetical protein